jgi:hypothetical protein
MLDLRITTDPEFTFSAPDPSLKINVLNVYHDLENSTFIFTK